MTLQALVGFIMAGAYDKLAQPQYVAGFAVVYGIFLSLGELGPGNKYEPSFPCLYEPAPSKHLYSHSP